MHIDQIKILNQLRSTSAKRQQAIRSIANDKKLKNDIIHHVLRNNGSEDEGLMVFHDSIVAFVKKVFTQHEFVLEGGIRAYIYGIGRKKWLTRIQKRTRMPTYQASEIGSKHDAIVDMAIKFDTKERNLILQDVLKNLKVKCNQVLMYWAGGYKMEEIAKLLGYKTAAVVRKKKYECLKELIVWLDQNQTIKNELKNN